LFLDGSKAAFRFRKIVFRGLQGRGVQLSPVDEAQELRSLAGDRAFGSLQIPIQALERPDILRTAFLLEI
jgi:hypothetical protein